MKLSTLLGLAPNGCHIVCFETCVLFLPGQNLDSIGNIVVCMDIVIFKARIFWITVFVCCSHSLWSFYFFWTGA